MKIPLVLLSGLLSNERIWEHQSRYLGDIASVQVISASQDTPDSMVQAILAAAPPEFALAGHSMGGWLCLEIMRAAPERVSKLCLLNTTARKDSEDKKARRQWMIQETKIGHFKDLVGNMAGMFIYNQQLKDTVEKMFLQVGEEAFVRQEQSMLMRRESISILSAITCPTLVIHAAKDNIFSIDEHREMAEQIPGATLAIVEDSGHMSPLEMPQEITALMRYWLTCF